MKPETSMIPAAGKSALYRFCAAMAAVLLACAPLFAATADDAEGSLKRLAAVADGRFSDARKADALLEMGDIHAAIDRTQEALNYYQSSLNYARSRKKKIAAFRRLSDVYYSQGSLGKAIEYAKAAAALSPRDTALARKLAAYYTEAGLLVQALDEYKKILVRRPDDAEALFPAAAAYEALGLYTDAAEHYKKAILRGGGRPGAAQLGAARCYEMLSHKKTAEALLREYLAVNPDYDGYIQLGKLYYSWGQYAAAASAFSSAVKINPRGREALLRAGMACYKDGRFEEASELFKISAAADQSCAAPRFFLGIALDASAETKKLAPAEYAAALKLSRAGSLLYDITAAVAASR